MTQKPHKTIILDANAFITGSGLLDLGGDSQFVTTPAVMEELRDAKTRQMLEKFVFPIKEMEPMGRSVELVREFAKKTGDLASLSDVDIGLLALAHTIYVGHGLEGKLRSSPPPMKEWQPKEGDQGDFEEEEEEDEDYPSSEEDKAEETVDNKKPQQPKEVSEKPEGEPQKPKATQQKAEQNDDDGWIVVPKSKTKKKQESDDDMDEDEGWVTPQNFEVKMAEGTASFQTKQTSEPQKTETSGISLMTADFAMQNVAIQMGIELKSLDGRQIKQIRRFILECYLCWKQYKVEDNVVKLCKQCGYNSLSKIAYSLSPNGEMILHRKKGWKPNQKVLEWKQRKLEEQQRKKKHQHARRKKEPSIFDV